MPRRKRVIIKAGDLPYIEFESGGPKKYLKKKRVKNPFANKAIYGYQSLQSEWYRLLIAEIISARRKQGLSQMTLAMKLDTNQSEISDLENGKSNPTVEFLDRLFKALNINIKILLS